MKGWTNADVKAYQAKVKAMPKYPVEAYVKPATKGVRYDPRIVALYFGECGLPVPEFEHSFHPERKWRFDIAFTEQRVFVEVQGGIWQAGRHSRGAGMKKDWEKWNAASGMGWRGIWCEPRDLCLMDTINTIRKALECK